MYKLEMKTKHQNKTQSHKKRKMQQQSTTFSGHHHRQKKNKKKKPVSSSSLAGQTQPADHHLRSNPSLKNQL
jgi:hypothetical protein